MQVGFHEVTQGVRVSFDDERKTLHISKYVTPIPGFHGDWQEVAKFVDERTWNKSEFAQLVMSNYYKELIMWFWIDISACSLQ